jgi:hypothetical protein
MRINKLARQTCSAAAEITQQKLQLGGEYLRLELFVGWQGSLRHQFERIKAKGECCGHQYTLLFVALLVFGSPQCWKVKLLQQKNGIRMTRSTGLRVGSKFLPHITLPHITLQHQIELY